MVRADVFEPVQLISPFDGEVLEVGTYFDWVWEQVPGGRGYIVRMRVPGTGDAFYQGCDFVEFETCYKYVQEIFGERYVSGRSISPMYWSVRAYWDMNYMTPWSTEWSFTSE
jgi:hypothetical protein